MLTYGDVRDFLTESLTALGYTDANPDTNEPVRTLPVVNPGPATIESLQKITPQALVFANVGNGAGLMLEQTYDQVFITIDLLGPQNDFEAAERLALDIDGALLALNGNGYIGSTRVLYVARTGGRPQLIDFDSSNRYRFQTTYITPAATGL